MKLTVDYDIGNGTQRAVIGVRAQVGWELRTKKKIGSIGDGYSVTDMVGLLMEQLKVDNLLPENIVNEAGFSRILLDLDPVDTDAEKEDGEIQDMAGDPLVLSPTEA